MTDSSRAVRFSAFEEPAGVLTIDDVPAPSPGPGEVLLRIAGGEGVAMAIDAVGGAVGATLAAALAPRGTTVRGFWLTRWFQESPPEHVATTIATVLGRIAEGAIDPPVEARYDLADVRAAVAHAERPGRGKVLRVG